MSTRFQLISPFTPSGDQPAAIDKIVHGLNQGIPHQALLGVTGAGKLSYLSFGKDFCDKQEEMDKRADRAAAGPNCVF